MQPNDWVRLRRSIWQAEFLGGGLLKLALATVLALVVKNLEPWGFQPTYDQIFLWMALVFTISIVQVNRFTNQMMSMIDEIHSGRATAISLLDEAISSSQTISVGGLFLDATGVTSALHDLMMTSEEGEFAKTTDDKGRIVYKTRGGDPKGPAKGGGADTFSEFAPRVDGLSPKPEFEDLEAPLSLAEKLIHEANKVQAEIAQERWERVESKDGDLIESGHTKLGDYIKHSGRID